MSTKLHVHDRRDTAVVVKPKNASSNSVLKNELAALSDMCAGLVHGNKLKNAKINHLMMLFDFKHAVSADGFLPFANNTYDFYDELTYLSCDEKENIQKKPASKYKPITDADGFISARPPMVEIDNSPVVDDPTDDFVFPDIAAPSNSANIAPCSELISLITQPTTDKGIIQPVSDDDEYESDCLTQNLVSGSVDRTTSYYDNLTGGEWDDMSIYQYAESAPSSPLKNRTLDLSQSPCTPPLACPLAASPSTACAPNVTSMIGGPQPGERSACGPRSVTRPTCSPQPTALPTCSPQPVSPTCKPHIYYFFNYIYYLY